ncbi:YihY family inner membrane protein [Massilia atriviolacea]|uniref:UPF0761 membrane protein EJB06_27030 n=1 Tax=Massilia atriviolacea TaxID=2495579 RepID=A0A430HE94_9BURK|nr:YihY family inner membrane protein [Massilia atriviolacea]RSZ55868.1 YihY family inner membrane protein [Massilia atriviolacea]
MINTSVDMVRGLTWNEARDLLRFARRRLNEERLPQVAGSLTFTSTLALVPLLTIVLAIFTTFPVFSNFRVALEAYFVQTLMPKAIANTITGNLTQFASKAKSLSVVGAVALVFTSAMMMNMIERAFNQIWRVRDVRPIAQRVTIYWALVTLGPLLFGLSLTATSQLFMATSALTGSSPFLSALFYTAASVGLTTGAYTLLYMTVPNRFVDWRDAVWGGLVAALAFEVAKRLFAMFVSQFPTYAIIYGALAALPLFLMWIYLSWMITLVGAIITAALPVIKYERWWYEPAPGAEFVDAMAILKVLYGGARVSDTALVSSVAIRAHTRIGYDEMTTLLEQMRSMGWVGRVQPRGTVRSRWGKSGIESAENWVLLVNVDKVTLADVYRLFVFGRTAIDAAGAIDADKDDQHGKNGPMILDGSALARQVEFAVEQGLNQTLAQHFAAPQLAAARA